MTELDFESSRNKAILNVMKKDRAQYFKLQKKYDALLSEHNVLKIQYLDLQADYIKKVYDV